MSRLLTYDAILAILIGEHGVKYSVNKLKATRSVDK